MPLPNSNKQAVLHAVEEAANNFLHYDREDDDALPEGSIEAFLEDGTITLTDIVDRFRTALEDALEGDLEGDDDEDDDDEDDWDPEDDDEE
jgi:hypothetical protein